MIVGMLDCWKVGMMLLLPTFQQSNLQSQDPGAILDRASASFDTVRTLQADFTQIVDNPMLGDPDTTRGKLFQQRPGYFAMRFTDPKGDRIVADGKKLWLYTPSTTPGQVIRAAIPATGSTGPNLIGQFAEHPRERYRARYVRSDSTADGAFDVLTLTPRTQDFPYSEATVWVAKRDGSNRPRFSNVPRASGRSAAHASASDRPAWRSKRCATASTTTK